MAQVMPAVFFGHGNPMNALTHNHWTRAWRSIGATIPRPRGVLCVSAHWYLPDTRVTATAAPRTIHDFGGFPRALYEIQYSAPGDPALARRVRQSLAPLTVLLDQSRGLDHGTWSVLRHVYPDADIPVVQLSIDETKPADFHFESGQKLAPLRDEGIFIMGSGNLVHNLHAYAWGHRLADPYEWAVRFETDAKEKMLAREYSSLVGYQDLGRDALMSIPTPDHYLPLLYVLGASRANDRVTFPVEGIDGGSVSMLAVQIG